MPLRRPSTDSTNRRGMISTWHPLNTMPTQGCAQRQAMSLRMVRYAPAVPGALPGSGCLARFGDASCVPAMTGPGLAYVEHFEFTGDLVSHAAIYYVRDRSIFRHSWRCGRVKAILGVPARTAARSKSYRIDS